jgi:cytosine/adenosine deaminase-related metal-dependent hydrolase
MIHAGEGTDERSRGGVDALVAANVLRQNTVLVHAIALGTGDAERIAEARACVVWCPQSNRRLYGQTADVAALRAAGVRIGLGSESPLAGARDALSNLASARGERALTDGELVALATAGSAEVARLPGGRVEAGQPADLIVVDSMDAWLDGDRRALALVVVAGKALYGDPALLDALAVRWRPVTVDGAVRGMESELARRAAGLLRGRDTAVEWMRGLVFTASPLPPGSPP